MVAHLDRLSISIGCTKHDTSNSAEKTEKYYKKIRSKDPETKSISSANAICTFIARKFKESSLYVHQKSVHLLAAVDKHYGSEIMEFCRFLTNSMVYCRGQRKLNLLKNAQFVLYLRPYIKILMDEKFSGQPILSDAAKKLIDIICNNKFMFIELIGFSFILIILWCPSLKNANLEQLTLLIIIY